MVYAVGDVGNRIAGQRNLLAAAVLNFLGVHEAEDERLSIVTLSFQPPEKLLAIQRPLCLLIQFHTLWKIPT